MSIRGSGCAYALGARSGAGEAVAFAFESPADLVFADLLVVVVDFCALFVKAHFQTSDARQFVLEPFQCHHACRAMHALDTEHLLRHISISSGELEVTAVHAHRAGVPQVSVGGACRNIDSGLTGLGQGPLVANRGDHETPSATGRAVAHNCQAHWLAGWRPDQIWGVAGVVDLDRDRSVCVRLSCDLWRTAAG